MKYYIGDVCYWKSMPQWKITIIRNNHEDCYTSIITPNSKQIHARELWITNVKKRKLIYDKTNN